MDGKNKVWVLVVVCVIVAALFLVLNKSKKETTQASGDQPQTVTINDIGATGTPENTPAPEETASEPGE